MRRARFCAAALVFGFCAAATVSAGQFDETIKGFESDSGYVRPFATLLGMGLAALGLAVRRRKRS